MAFRGANRSIFSRTKEQSHVPRGLGNARAPTTYGASDHAPGTSSSNAPVGYVAGLGRGAIGFTTRSDIGPAMGRKLSTASSSSSSMVTSSSSGAPKGLTVSFGQAPAGYVPGAGRGATAFRKEEMKGGIDRGDYSATNYDSFSGYGGSLFNKASSNPNAFSSNDNVHTRDSEADAIYDAVDRRMDGRRKRQREALMKKNMEKYRMERPKISDQFADLKRELSTVSEAEWGAIPDIGAQSLIRNKKKVNRLQEQYTPVPDSILQSTLQKAKTTSSIGTGGGQLGESTTGMNDGQETDVHGLFSSKKNMLSIMLDRGKTRASTKAFVNDGTKTAVDPKGYMTGLQTSASTLKSDADIADIKKARLLYSSIRSSNPKHAPAWIASARLEEHAGKFVEARKLLSKGCKLCPTSEDIWLESARLQALSAGTDGR
eukprot:g1886.t1